MTTTTSIHKRSRSDPVPKRSLKNNKSREAICNIDRFHMDQTLQREIEQLKSLVKCRKLQHQRVSCDEIDFLFQEDKVLVQREMETVLRRKLFLEDCKNKDPSIPKEAKKLVSEIAGLEMQVMYLERYLLLLYRRFFNKKITTNLEPEEKEISEDLLESTNLIDSPKTAVCSPQKVLEDSGIFRSHSSLSHCSGYSFRMSPQAMDSSYHHSLPFSMLEQADIDAMVGTYVSQNVTKSPNSLSEEMIKCISEVFRQLADPESLDDDRESSSSPFRRKGHQKVIGRPYDKLLMVKSICRDSEKLNEVEPALKHFRSLVNKLEGVNPRKLNHEEKLAFWINIHNSLVMHSILVYGNPKNSMKRLSGLLKAAYNVGGRSLNLDTIQTSILRCRVSRPGQVFRFLFASKSKGKAGDLGKDYAITHPEPLLHFALCSGNFSDPSVRIYTPKNVMMELECGKEEYVRSNVGISKDNKILLPKLVELYAKDTELCHVGILDAIVNYLPCDARNKVQQCMNKKHGRFTIDWVAHDFRFRLLL